MHSKKLGDFYDRFTSEGVVWLSRRGQEVFGRRKNGLVRASIGLDTALRTVYPGGKGAKSEERIMAAKVKVLEFPYPISEFVKDLKQDQTVNDEVEFRARRFLRAYLALSRFYKLSFIYRSLMAPFDEGSVEVLLDHELKVGLAEISMGGYSDLSSNQVLLQASSGRDSQVPRQERYRALLRECLRQFYRVPQVAVDDAGLTPWCQVQSPLERVVEQEVASVLARSPDLLNYIPKRVVEAGAGTRKVSLESVFPAGIPPGLSHHVPAKS